MSDRREERRRQAELANAKEKKRMFLFAAGLVVCIGIIVSLNLGGGDPQQPDQRDETIQSITALPPIGAELLAQVKDSTTAERVILEPAAFSAVAKSSIALYGEHLYKLGEPAFPFAEGEARAADLRGEPYRLRGAIVDAEIEERVPGEEPEYWALMQTDAGEQFFFASGRVPEILFGNDNYALADGFFFKYYTRTVGDTRVTAPLFVGRQLEASYREVAAVDRPDPLILAQIRDPEHGELGDVADEGLWHLYNVCLTQQAKEGGIESVFADAPVLDDALLEDLVRTPELYRGKIFLLGGQLRGDAWTTRLGENPLRLRDQSGAFIRDNSSGIDTLIELRAPGRFNFTDPPGVVQFHGWFLQMHAYEDTVGTPRRVPVFVVADMEGVKGEPPPWANDVLYGFIGLSVLLGGFMFWIVRRDRQRAEAFQADRRAKRRQAGNA